MIRYTEITRTAEVLKSGGVIVYPTDTAYGLGADATNPAAVQRVFDLKGRDRAKPIHVVVRDLVMAKSLVEFNPLAEKIFQKLLPGPLTIVLPKKSHVLDLLTGGLPTLGIRVPNHPICLELSQSVNFPYTATSANLSGSTTPYSPNEVTVQADFLLDGDTLPRVAPSTIVDLSDNEIKILREGPVSAEKLYETAGA
jgi:L-threonylcarbamoyladenylate synthase